MKLGINFVKSKLYYTLLLNLYTNNKMEMLGLYNMWQVLAGCFYKKSTYKQVRNYSNFFYYNVLFF